jgi:osomolarity two-component system response regulator SKN7
MDDVLPKPFTRKSLLDMLEKHLVHLKNIPPSIEAAPTSATAVSMAQSSATQSVKDDSSPGQSPATSMNNWQSPSQFQGISPIHTNVPNQYVAQQPPTPTTYTVDQNGMQYPTQTPINAAAARQHRRQVSEMSSTAEINNFAKRPRVYAPNNPPVNQLQTGRPS